MYIVHISSGSVPVVCVHFTACTFQVLSNVTLISRPPQCLVLYGLIKLARYSCNSFNADRSCPSINLGGMSHYWWCLSAVLWYISCFGSPSIPLSWLIPFSDWDTIHYDEVLQAMASAGRFLCATFITSLFFHLNLILTPVCHSSLPEMKIRLTMVHLRFSLCLLMRIIPIK